MDGKGRKVLFPDLATDLVCEQDAPLQPPHRITSSSQHTALFMAGLRFLLISRTQRTLHFVSMLFPNFIYLFIYSHIDYYFCYHRDFRLPPAEGKDALRGCPPSYTVYGQHWKLLGQLIPALHHSTLIQHQLVLVQHLQFLWREAKILVMFHFHFLQNSWKMHFVILHCKITQWV